MSAGCVTMGLPRFQSTLPTRGSDRRFYPHVAGGRNFNPRSPRGGATVSRKARRTKWKHFNPRSPRGGATRRKQYLILIHIISIHAPHEGERPCAAILHRHALRHFNPRSPRGGATAKKCIYMQHFSEFAEYYPLRHGDARCIAPQDCIIQAFFGAKKRCFYVRLCFALKNKGVRG